MEKFFQELHKPSPASTPQNVIESFYDSIGMMRSDWSPFLRVAFGFGLIAGLEWVIKPSFAFDASGRARPWSLTYNSNSSTMVPWWLPAVLFGLSQGLFV